jgi:hypothetical protein
MSDQSETPPLDSDSTSPSPEVTNPNSTEASPTPAPPPTPIPDPNIAALPVLITQGINQLFDVLRQFIQIKYGRDNRYMWAHLGVVFLLLVTIVVLTLFAGLDKCTVGTLLGSVIGYSLGKFSQGNGNSGAN